MNNHQRRGAAAAALLLVFLLAGGCGGGGGKTQNPVSNPTSGNSGNIKKIAGKFETGTARTADRSAEAVANVPVLVYEAGDDDKTQLNSSSDTTDGQGSFEVDVNFGSRSAIDIIVELAGNNLKLAVDNMSQDVASVTGNPDTTRKAVIFDFLPTESLSNISLIDNLYDDRGIDITGTVNSTSYAAQFMNEMKAVVNECNISSSALSEADKTCLIEQIDSALDSSGASQLIKNLVESLENIYRSDLDLPDLDEYLQIAGVAAGAANTPVLVYSAGDTAKTRLNSADDITDGSGVFDVLVAKEEGFVSADLIVEFSGSNLKLALDGLTSRATGLTVDAGTTRKAVLFDLAPGFSLSTISNIDDIFYGESIDVTDTVTDSTAASAFVSDVKAALDACSITSAVLADSDKLCLASKIETVLDTTASPQAVRDLIESLALAFWDDLGYFRVSGEFETTSGQTVIAYEAGDSSKTRLNAADDTTDSDGAFDIRVEIGNGNSKDIIIEVQGQGLKVAAPGVSDDVSGIEGDAAATRVASIFHLAPDTPLSDISLVDELYFDQEYDVSQYITTSAEAASFLEHIDGVLTSCNVTGSDLDNQAKARMSSELEILLYSLSAEEAVEYMLESLRIAYIVDIGAGSDYHRMADTAHDADRDDLAVIAEIFADGQVSLSSLDEPEIEELVAKMQNAIATWQETYGTEVAKRVAIKDEMLALYRGESFTNSTVKSKISWIKGNFVQLIQAPAAADTSLIDEYDLGSLISAYDVIRGVFIQTLVEDAQATSAQALNGVDAVLFVVAALGAASEDSSTMGVIMDNWVTEWDKDSVMDELLNGLDPLNMDDQDKLENLMLLAHDMQAELPAEPTDEEMLTIFNRYLTTATSNEALALYRQYNDNGCEINISVQGTNSVSFSMNKPDVCPGKEELISLIETHYEKGTLTKLRAVIEGVEEYLAEIPNNDGIAVANAYLIFDGVLTDMKASEQNKTELSDAMRTAGIKPELFWLYMNLEPYMNQ